MAQSPPVEFIILARLSTDRMGGRAAHLPTHPLLVITSPIAGCSVGWLVEIKDLERGLQAAWLVLFTHI